MKNWTKLLPVTTILCSMMVATLQTNAQPGKQVVVNISGIEYDDPNFTSFREIVKKTAKVSSVKPSYVSGMATLTCVYPGTPSDLWDNIPKGLKQSFKLTSVNDNSIELDYTKSKTNGAAYDKTSGTNDVNKNNCFDCVYFPMCNYDVTKSYEGGKKFRGIRKDDNSVVYYYCEKGDVIMRWDYTKPVTRQEWVSTGWDNAMISYDEYVNKTASLTILRANLPVGATWTGTVGDKEHLYRMEAKGIKLIHEGKTYNDVIKVREYSPGSIDYHYYARNVGYVGRNLVDEPMKQRLNAINTWAGIWKLTSDDGNLISPDAITEYLQIGERGATLSYYVTKKSTGKFYPVNQSTIPGYDPISQLDNQAGSTLFLKFRYASGKDLEMNKNSVPKKTISIGSKIYEYLGERFDFNK